MNRKQLIENIFRKKSFLCVGLDPDASKMPESLAARGAEGIFEFNRAIIDATATEAVAYKPNLAFYEAYGAEGLKAFADTCEYIRRQYPDLFIIADAKRGDIGNTARMYARAFFEKNKVDAVTVAPYMGSDSVQPFLEFEGKWAVLLALTSNQGSSDFQMIKDASGKYLFENVVSKACEWGNPDNLMFVVGATRGDLIAEVRKLAPKHFFLVPGIGAQGGSLEDVCNYGLTEDVGLLVNSSRGIIHASSSEKEYAEAARSAANKLRTQMAAFLKR